MFNKIVGSIGEKIVNSEEKKDKNKTNKYLINPKDKYCEQLYPIDKKTREELSKMDILDLTQMLWEEHNEKIIDLCRNPYCIGRSEVIKQIGCHLVTLEKPSNVIVHGPSGTGKTTLISEIARKIVIGKAGVLNKLHLFVVKSIKKHDLEFVAEKLGRKAILVFDECHTNILSEIISISEFFSAFGEIMKSSLYSLNFVDRNKTLLDDNKLMILGFTDRLGTFLESDPSRKRRFTIIELKEMSIESTCLAVKGRGFLEKCNERFKCELEISDETIKTAIYLSLVYYKEIAMPAKVYLVLEPAIMWYMDKNPKAKSVPPQAIVDYMVEVEEKKKEDLVEQLKQMRDLAECPIPPHEPLSKYSTNLTSYARCKRLAPAWQRGKLIGELGSIFLQKEFNNVLLLSPPGGGKTRISEGLAYAIQNGQLPQLKGKEVLLLDWQLAQKDLPGLLKSAKKYEGKFILVIDEAHRLSQGGFSINDSKLNNLGNIFSNPFESITTLSREIGNQVGGSNSAFDELKEAMGRGELPVLLLSTHSDAVCMLKDEAICRRLMIKNLEPLTKKQVEKIMKKDAPKLNKSYGINMSDIEDSAIEAIYYLSKCYHKTECQPSASFKMLHCVYAYIAEKKLEKITLDAVFEAVAIRIGVGRNEVEEKYILEKVSDHPSSHIIAEGEPLKRFTYDLTKEARMGFFPSYVGYEGVFLEMLDTLQLKTCNNVVLVGRAGCGKTTLIKRLAMLMASKNEEEIPFTLRNKPLLLLRVTELLQNPENFSGFVDCCKKYAGKFVLFIDEFHLFLGGSSKRSSTSYELEVLKPLLSDGSICLIGATTQEDIELNEIEITESIERRFDWLELKAPSKEEAIKMLNHTKESMEMQLSKKYLRKVTFDKGCIEKAVELAEQEKLPDSAISILERGVVQALSEKKNEEGELAIKVGHLKERKKLSLFFKKEKK